MAEAKHKSALELTKTPHILPSRVSYGLSLVRVLDEIDCLNGIPLYIDVVYLS